MTTTDNTAKWIGSAILAVIAGTVIGQIAQIPLAVLLDLIYGKTVTGGRWPLNSANFILIIVVGLITGFSTGWIAKKRGKLLGAIAQFFPIFIIVTIGLVKNVDLTPIVAQRSDTPLALWVWIGLIPAIVGGHYGAERNMKIIRISIVSIGVIVLAVGGISGFFLCLEIISKAAGFWGLVVALTIAPITFVAAPLYAGFAWGDWFPLELSYGSGIMGAILIVIGSAMVRD